ncbi:MAG: LPS assembly protein LptD [Brevundimonas sp.]
MRRRLLAGGAALALAPGLAMAQQTPAGETAPGAVYIDAEDIVRDSDTGQISARGSDERVLARFEGRNLRGREVTYNLDTGVATASGDVELSDVDGTVVTADQLELDENLQTGVAVNLAVRAPDGSHLMAATAVRRSPAVNELNYALFTPCPICDDDGERKEPTWSIQAQKVVQDENLRAILYQNALFRVGGVPVLWLPFFAHPDPTVERASGFLVPRIDYDEARGLSYEQPYLIVRSPSEDWIISPQFNTEVNPFLNVQWRRHFGDGIVQARAGYTYEDIPGVEDEDHRGYLLAHGTFDPAGPLRWGFTAERASDKTLFDRYGTDNPYQDNGLYYGDRRRLISQVYVERQTERSYLSAAAFTIQSLRVLEVNRANPADNVFERDGVTPVAAPVIEAMWEPRQDVLGGRLRLGANAAVLVREDYVGAPVLAPGEIPVDPSDPDLAGYPGVDSARVVVTADWRRVLTSPIGLRWEPFLNLRADAYVVDDLPASPGTSETVTRARATAGLDVSYPLIRRFGNGADLVLEPLAQISISNPPDLDPRLPNEDSQVTDLDETSLFATDRFTGHDLYEGGLRVTGGGRASLRWGNERSASVFLGRSWREEAEDRYLVPTGDGTGSLFDPSGLATRASDWVVAATFSPGPQIRGWAHAQIDDGGEIRRAEVMVDGSWGARNLATVSYIIDRSNPVDVDPELPLATRTYRNYEFVQFSGQQFISGNWGVAGRGIMDLQEDRFTRSEVGLLFEDDCIRFEIGYRRDNTRVDPSGPRTGAYVRLTLATLGGTGYQRDDMW